MAGLNVSVPAGGVELCVQDGQSHGSVGRCFPARPKFDHAKPGSLPLSHGEWAQFQAKVQDAVAGMKSERAAAYCISVSGFVVAVVLLLAFASGDFEAWNDSESGHGRRLEGEAEDGACLGDVTECADGSFVSRDAANECQFQACPLEGLRSFGLAAGAAALGAAAMGLSLWVSSRNKQQDEFIRGACSDLARASGGQVMAEYHTFFTGPFQVRGRQPHRVIVIAPSQQAQAAAEVIPVAEGVLVQPAPVGHAEEP